jgi:hypothetical protein
MTSQRTSFGASTMLKRLRSACGRVLGVGSRSSEDRKDQAVLNAALDAQERGDLEIISHAEVTARLGYT